MESKSGPLREDYSTVISTQSGNQRLLEISDKPSRYDILERIAFCESGGGHFEDNGQVLKGKLNSSDIGKYQINEKYWKTEASRLGLNLYDPTDNEVMARWIYDHYGTAPWSWSKGCWDNNLQIIK